MVALLSCHSTLPDSAPLASYRCDREVKVMKYNQALQALREIVERTGRNPKAFMFGGGGWSLRISSFTCYFPPRPDRPRDPCKEEENSRSALSHQPGGSAFPHIPP